MKINRRTFIQTSTLAFAGLSASADPPRPATPVILATDIGDDIDDTWALGFLLKCPELNLKLVATEYGKANYRAKLLAKFLQTTGRGNIPIAVGPDVEPRGAGDLLKWVNDYDLKSYPVRVHADGIGAIVDAIMNSPEPVTVIAIGPMPNIAAALKREPRIATRARIVGMDGSVRVGYDGSKTPCGEWNVKADAAAARQCFTAPWEMTITPLDTCGLVSLDGARYQRLLQSRDPVASTIIENYRLWSTGKREIDPSKRSSTLFDTVAVYLAVAQEFCRMERLGLRVTDDGMTIIDPQAKQMNAATAWTNMDGFKDLLVDRLCGV